MLLLPLLPLLLGERGQCNRLHFFLLLLCNCKWYLSVLVVFMYFILYWWVQKNCSPSSQLIAHVVAVKKHSIPFPRSVRFVSSYLLWRKIYGIKWTRNDYICNSLSQNVLSMTFSTQFILIDFMLYSSVQFEFIEWIFGHAYNSCCYLVCQNFFFFPFKPETKWGELRKKREKENSKNFIKFFTIQQ